MDLSFERSFNERLNQKLSGFGTKLLFGKNLAEKVNALRDAVNLVGMRNTRWDGHYYQFKPVYNTIDRKY